MTYEEFKKLTPDVLAKLRKLELPPHLQNRANIWHFRSKGKMEKLYFIADQAEKHKLIDFTPAPKPVPKPVPPAPKPVPLAPKPVPPIVEDREVIVPLPTDKPIPVNLDEVTDDGEEG